MLEKLGTPGHEFISTPDPNVLDYMQIIIHNNPDPIYYEVGIGIGATTLPVAEMLNNRGQIFLFSKDRDVKELSADLNDRGYKNINVDWGSPTKTFSGYHFELARGMLDKSLPMFDLAYLDGGHVFHLDASATAILKELCLPNGYILFDDYRWSLASSAALNPIRRPATLTEYDDMQIRSCHVEMVCKIMMDTDPRFELIAIEKDTAIYQKNYKVLTPWLGL